MRLSLVNKQLQDKKRSFYFNSYYSPQCSYLVSGSVSAEYQGRMNVTNSKPIEIISESDTSNEIFMKAKQLEAKGYRRMSVFPNNIRVEGVLVPNLSMTVYGSHHTNTLMICHSSVKIAIDIFGFKKKPIVEI